MSRLGALGLLLASVASGAAPPAEPFSTRAFGEVLLFGRSARPRQVVVLFSGERGWEPAAARLAERLAGQDALVVGVDSARYLRSLASAARRCAYPAGDVEGLSQAVQKKRALARYLPPALVGYGQGASLAYAALAQAPPNTFRGAVTLDFCAELRVAKPLCAGTGLKSGHEPARGEVQLLPSARLGGAWMAFSTRKAGRCSMATAASFQQGLARAESRALPEGDPRSALERWAPGVEESLGRLFPREEPPRAPSAGSTTPGDAGVPLAVGEDVRDLPLIEVPATAGSSELFAVILSGDGGWAGIDRDLAGALAARGINVVGLDSLQYFWTARTADGAAKDLARVVAHYQARWGKRRLLLIGYSFGADVLPFMARRLDPKQLGAVALVAFLGLSKDATFEFHLSDWLGGSGEGQPVLPEVQQLAGRPMLCVYGSEEKDESLCAALPAGLARVVELEGGHHFSGDYDALAKLIVDTLGEGASP